ncbi:MAG: AraC family transcriptional regulator [Ruminococcaceae bacterium]|nr:AraC family transcriptional regulator [Oscillospiraceae bacterium]HHV31619.1 AraC family transcriptional regulator [Clostridiales bacterium]
MQDLLLKEKRRHGDLSLPISSYYMDLHNETTLLDCHWHTELELFKIRKGKFHFQIASSSLEGNEGDLIFINTEELHSAWADKKTDACYSAVVFSPDMLAGSAEDCVFTKYLSPLLTNRLAVKRRFDQSDTEIQKHYDCIYNLLSQRPKAYELFLKSNLFALLGILVQTAPKGDLYSTNRKESQAIENIKQSIRYMQNHYGEKITVAALARFCHMSEGNYSRMFHRYTLKSPICYLNRMRLLQAAEMLKNTDNKILEVALDCGFGSLSYFINVFRENMGVSPSEYRRRWKENALGHETL